MLTEDLNSIIIYPCSNIDNLDDIVAVAIEAEFHAYDVARTAEGKDERPAGPKDLNDPERSRLTELFVASRALTEPVDLQRTAATVKKYHEMYPFDMLTSCIL